MPAPTITFKVVRKPKLPQAKHKYPFAEMEIGDAFYVPCPVDLRGNVQAQVHHAAKRYRAKHNPEFRITVHSDYSKEQFSVAVFRIA